MAKCPKTAVEAWKRLDRNLDQIEKQYMAEADSLRGFLFLKMWIKENWFCRGEMANIKSLLIDMGEKFFDMAEDLPTDDNEEDNEPLPCFDLEHFANTILDGYHKHLKERL